MSHIAFKHLTNILLLVFFYLCMFMCVSTRANGQTYSDRRVQVLMLTVINFQMCSEDKCECSVL